MAFKSPQLLNCIYILFNCTIYMDLFMYFIYINYRYAIMLFFFYYYLIDVLCYYDPFPFHNHGFLVKQQGISPAAFHMNKG